MEREIKTVDDIPDVLEEIFAYWRRSLGENDPRRKWERDVTVIVNLNKVSCDAESR